MVVVLRGQGRVVLRRTSVVMCRSIVPRGSVGWKLRLCFLVLVRGRVVR